MKTLKLSVSFVIVLLLLMVAPAHAWKLCLQLIPEALGAGASDYILAEIPTGDGNFLLSGKSSTVLPYPPFTKIEAVVTGGGGLIDGMLEISLDEKRTDGSDFIVKQVHMILDPKTKVGTYERVQTTYPTVGNSGTITQLGTVAPFSCGRLNYWPLPAW